MQLWALFWHIRDLTDQPIALGGIGAARILPVILFSLIGGAVADSFNRRKVLFITQSSAALIALTLGLLTDEQVWEQVLAPFGLDRATREHVATDYWAGGYLDYDMERFH
jgi:MFS family permease